LLFRRQICHEAPALNRESERIPRSDSSGLRASSIQQAGKNLRKGVAAPDKNICDPGEGMIFAYIAEAAGRSFCTVLGF